MFKPTTKEVKHFFNIINWQIFDGILSMPKVTFYKHFEEEWWAYSGDGELDLLDNFPTQEFFVEILGHEMVHLWETEILNKKPEHGKEFWTWKEKFAKLGLELRETYQLIE